MKTLFLILLIALPLVLLDSLQAQSVSTNSAITYQGRLVNPNGSPLTGTINLTFSIYDSLSTGTGNLLCQQIISNTTLENGVFNVSLNFDSSYPSGDCNVSDVLREKMNAGTPLYIEVIHTSGSTTKTYPRQLLTSVPYALAVVNQAISDLNLKGISSRCSSGKILKADGNGGFTCSTGTATFAEAVLPSCSSGQALTGNGTALSCVSMATALGAGSISTTELADSGVTTAKIANLAVTTAKIAADAVTSAKIADGTVANTDLTYPYIYVTPGNGITGGGQINLGTATNLAVNADDITLGFSSGKIQIKPAAIVSGVTYGVAASNINYNSDHFTASGTDQLNLNFAATGSGLDSGATGIFVQVDAGSALEINGSNSLDVKAGGITGTNIATGTITNDKIDSSISLTVADVTTTALGAFNVKNTTGTPSEVRFFEGTPNGANYIGLRAPYSLSSNVVWTLPSSEGSPSAILTTNGAGVLSWSNINSVDSDKITDGSIVNADIANGTISFAKLNSMANNTILAGYSGTPLALAVNGDIAPTASATNLTLMIGADTVTSAKILDSTIMDADVNPTAAIDTTKLSTGIVSNDEFDTLDGINGTPIQTQISAKQDLIIGTDDITLNRLTANDAIRIKADSTATYYIEIKAPVAALSANKTYYLPEASSTPGYIMVANDSGNLGLGTDSPTNYGDGGASQKYFEIYNSGTGAGSQAIVQLSTGSTDAGGIGAVNFVARNASSNKRVATITGNIQTTDTTNPSGKLEFYTATTGGVLTNRMTIDEAGAVTVANSITSGAFYYSSDKRLKRNIASLDHFLPKILGMDSIQFNWKQEPVKDSKPILQYGFIAQEVQKTFPNLVQTNSDGFLKVNYVGLISPIVQSIKEFYAEFFSLRMKVNRMEKENAEMKAEIQELREMIEQQQKSNK